MAYRAVDRHNMMEGTPFRVEELKFLTFDFKFLALVYRLSPGERVLSSNKGVIAGVSDPYYSSPSL